MLSSAPDLTFLALSFPGFTGLPIEVDLALRALVVYAAGLVIIRVGKNRLLGRTTAFDIVLAFILGSLFSRAINGTAPVTGTIAAGVVLVVLHWGIAEFSRRAKWMERLVKGRHVELIHDGVVQQDTLRRAEVSENDLREALRLKAHADDPSQVRRACLERNGEISVMPMRNQPHVFEVNIEAGVKTIRIQLG